MNTTETAKALDSLDAAHDYLGTDQVNELPHANLNRTGDHNRILAVTTATSRDAYRPILTGLNTTDDTIAATDSYRMHWATLTDQALTEVLNGLTIDAHQLARFIGKPTHNKTIRIVRGPNGIVLERTNRKRTGNKVDWLALNNIDGKYPNWRTLIPNPDSHQARTIIPALTTLPGKAWQHALNAATALHKATDTLNPVRLNITGNTAHLSTNSTDQGQWTSPALPVETHDGIDIDAAYNPTYLADTLEATSTGTYITLNYRNNLKPLVVNGTDVDALLMPVRI